MNPFHAIGLALLVLLAGCAGFDDASGQTTSFDLSIQNDGTRPVSYQVTVTDAAGEVVTEETDELGAGVGRGHDLSIDGSQPHEVVVSGDDWRHTFTVTPDTCEAYEERLRITDDEIRNDGGCVTVRE